MDPTHDLYAEDWAPTHDAPALFELDGTSAVEPAEAPSWTAFAGVAAPAVPLAFVDGTRRVEAGLWQVDRVTGATVRGVAGAYAVGATVCRPGVPAAYAGVRRARLCIWSAGATGDLGPSAGYLWRSVSLATADPDAPVLALQDRMRDAEAALARELADGGWQVVLDGPLSRLRSLRSLVAGYTKTHHRQLLPDDQHRLVPSLRVGERSALWALGAERYTCYLRVGDPTAVGSPWSGVVRLEFPSHPGLDAVRRLADVLAGSLPRYAGRHHLDPRAPQNLQPVRALERHLAKVIGSHALAGHAARAAVAAAQLRAGRRRAPVSTAPVGAGAADGMPA